MRIVLLITLLLGSLHLSAQTDIVRQRVQAEYRSAPSVPQVAEWLRAMRPDGTWPDIDYQDHSRSLWQLEKHLDRLVGMALVYESSVKRDTLALQKILRGIEHWYAKDYHNDNWWYEKIGVPRRMLQLAYVLDDDLPMPLRSAISKSLDAIDSEDHPARPGGDRIQVLSNHAKVLLWRRDLEGAVALFKKIEAEARVAPFEAVMYDAGGNLAVRNEYRPSGRGLQADLTFHHRGDRVNSTTTYGLELPEYFAYWAHLLQDTPWHFTDTAVHTVVDYFLDGVCRHLVKGCYVEPAAYNRELSRPLDGAMNGLLARRLLAVCGGYRTGELQYMAEVQQGKAVFESSYAHHFWQSDYFVFSRPHYQSAVRLHSMRNANQEAPHNNEGLRNHFRGDGACHLSVTGREYHGLPPVFDFRRIPGVTAPLLPYDPLPAWGRVNLLTSETVFAGAVCDSLFGAVAFDFKSQRSDLRARKAWFFFDEGYVCLGSDINCSTADSISTTIEQCRQQSSLHRQGSWFFHGGNGYQVIDGSPQATIEHRHGSWSNCVSGVAYAADTLSAPVFTLSLNHGQAPVNGHYAYAVVPSTMHPIESWFRILHNGDGIQAVEHKQQQLVYVAFYRPGTVKTKVGRIQVDRPCMVMVHDGSYYVSDASHLYQNVTLSVDKKTLLIPLPANLYAGSSQKVPEL